MSYSIIDIKKEELLRAIQEDKDISEHMKDLSMLKDMKIVIPSIQAKNGTMNIRFISKFVEKFITQINNNQKLGDDEKIDKLSPELHNIYIYDSLIDIAEDDKNPNNIYIDINGTNKFFIPESSLYDNSAFDLNEKYLLFIYLSWYYKNSKKK